MANTLAYYVTPIVIGVKIGATTLSIKTFRIYGLLSILTIYKIAEIAWFHYADCIILVRFMFNVVMLSVVVSVLLLNVIRMSVTVNVIILFVGMLNVEAPTKFYRR
jgi:hypothetical protein